MCILCVRTICVRTMCAYTIQVYVVYFQKSLNGIFLIQSHDLLFSSNNDITKDHTFDCTWYGLYSWQVINYDMINLTYQQSGCTTGLFIECYQSCSQTHASLVNTSVDSDTYTVRQSL